MTPSEIINRFSGWENDEGIRGIIADALEEVGFDIEANAMRNDKWKECPCEGLGDGGGRCYGYGHSFGSGDGGGHGYGDGQNYGYGGGDGFGSGCGDGRGYGGGSDF